MQPNQQQLQAQKAAPTTAIPQVWQRFADVLGVTPSEAKQVLVQQIMPKGTPAEVLAFVAVAGQYGLNPLTKQIYAFPSKAGGIVPMVSIDGWLRLIQSHPDFDGVEFAYTDADNGRPISVTCTMHRKGMGHPVQVTEYLEECHRNTDPWNKSPRRMLRHRAIIQAARIAFGFGGLTDEEDFGTPAPAEKPEPRHAEVEALTRAMDPKRAPAAQVEPEIVVETEPEPDVQPQAEQPAANFEDRFQ
jgi:phage recombination protein Bet